MLHTVRRHRLLHLLACLAVALMLVAPLVSRWNQARASEPMCTSGPALDTVAAQHAGHLPAQHAGHSQHGSAASHRVGDQDAGLHGEACDYCVLAARLLPWLALLVLCLLRVLPSPTPGHTRLWAWSALRWTALGARGPPLSA
ncbi:DUF2946 family protein [Xanthomonas sp. WHRI 6106]|uniref:DUF2946 family protein n=1 Tax=Xanthomonas sp. WHRI 6106 TaxID=3161566 RepID=UPI0032E8E8B3